MDSQVEEIKRKLDIVDIINRYLPLKKRGRHHLACCPFHQEKTPSFTVSPELQIFKCFGCGKSGDVFTFIQEYERIDFKEALEELAKIAGVVLVKNPAYNRDEARRHRILEINHHLLQFYHYLLLTHPLGKSALDYILKRGLTLETIKTFKLGFSPADSALVINYLTKKNFSADDLISTGTFGQNQSYHRLYDRFCDRLIFPQIDYRDRILGFSGRLLPTSRYQNAGKYINSPETDVYHKSQMVYGLNLSRESIKKSQSVIVVEGEFDFLSPYQAGFTNIVAIKGTAFTEGQLQLLRRLCDTLILALDSDFAGNNAARKSIALADSFGFDIKVIDFAGKFKDPDEAVRSDPSFFRQQLEHALPVWDFLLNTAFLASDPETGRGKTQIIQQVLPSLIKITNAVIRHEYLKKLADGLGSDLNSILEEAKKIDQPAVSLPPPVASSKTSDSNQIEKLESYLLSLVFTAKNPLILIADVIQKIGSFSLKKHQDLALLLLSQTTFDPSQFQLLVSPELLPFFQSLFLSQPSLDSVHRQNEITKTIRQLKTILIKEKLSLLSRKISQLENLVDDQQLKSAEKNYQQLLLELSQLQKK